MSAHKIKAANDRLAAEWRKSDVIHEYSTLDKKLSKEGAGYNQNKVFHGKTLKEIADELKKEHTLNNQNISTKDCSIAAINLAGDSHDDTHD